MNIDQKEQNKMCTQCKTFFGSESNNWMCSSCFKSSIKTSTQQTKKNQPIVQQFKLKQEQPQKPQQADKSRCFKCNKKIGLLATNCKCSYAFCNLHRLPEDHECEVDYRKLGKQALEKKVEKVASRKVSQI